MSTDLRTRAEEMELVIYGFTEVPVILPDGNAIRAANYFHAQLLATRMEALEEAAEYCRRYAGDYEDTNALILAEHLEHRALSAYENGGK